MKNGKILTVNQFKGGVGKSTLIQMISVVLANRGKKVLLIDTDPQANLTNKILREFPDLDLSNEQNVFEAIQNQSFKKAAVRVSDNLDLVQGTWEMSSIIDYVIDLVLKTGQKTSLYYMYNYIVEQDNIRNDYDYIIFDTIPTTTVYTNNCLVASDYILVPTQTEQDSIDNLENIIEYVDTIKKNYNPDLKLVGVVPYLVDRYTTGANLLDELYDEYGDIVFKNYIKSSGVVKRWGKDGYTTDQPYDKITTRMYERVVDELLSKLEE